MMSMKGFGWKRGLVLFEVLSQHLPGETEENHKKCVRITGVPVEIQTEHNPITNPQRHRYTNRCVLLLLIVWLILSMFIPRVTAEVRHGCLGWTRASRRGTVMSNISEIIIWSNFWDVHSGGCSYWCLLVAPTCCFSLQGPSVVRHFSSPPLVELSSL
jgi:hypothetical protein